VRYHSNAKSGRGCYSPFQLVLMGARAVFSDLRTQSSLAMSFSISLRLAGGFRYIEVPLPTILMCTLDILSRTAIEA